MLVLAILGNLLTTGCAVLMFRRGPRPRLKQLSFTAGMMSMTQTVVAFMSFNGSPLALGFHSVLTVALAIYGFCLLQDEWKEERVLVVVRRHTADEARTDLVQLLAAVTASVTTKKIQSAREANHGNE